MDRPYSYHTFLLPFLWNSSGEIKTLNDFESKLNKTGEIRWIPQSMDGNHPLNKELYDQIQHFKKDAANILLPSGDRSVVRHYLLQGKTANFSRTHNGAPAGQYRISRREWNGYEICYLLDINQIRLSVYNAGVALLAIELENWGEKLVNGKARENGARNLDDANAINEYGRRIKFPFLPDDIRSSLTAEKIEISLDGKTYCEDFAGTLAQGLAMNPHYIMKPLRRLLNPNGCFTTDRQKALSAPELFFIEPVVDDRMYVCSEVMDAALSAQLSQLDDDGSYKILSSEELYKTAFIEVSCTCHSNTMRRDILKRCIYDRWINYGTVDVVTHHSLVRITSPDAPAYVVDPFLTQYVQMASLALLQRATLIALEDQCVLCTQGSKGQQERSITRLQEAYIMAQKDILLDECTVQEQGAEEFTMLRRELFIPEQAASLEKRLQGLYKLASLNHSRTQERLSKIISVIGFLITLTNFFDLKPLFSQWLAWLFGG